MSEASTIKINPSKNSDLEFDVMIQGIDDINIPVVKFVITSEAAGCDYAFRCKRVDGDKNKWLAKLPALAHIKENSVKFHVEVIIDGYYFEPAHGDVYLVTDPSVKFQPTASKPSVTTSFTVKQDKDPTIQVAEDQELPNTIPGDNSPTNALLKPEAEAAKHSGKSRALPDKEDTTIEDLSSHVTPGSSSAVVISLPEKNEDEDEEFDPKRVAESIVKNTFGAVQKPLIPGTLFKRDGTGKTVIDGLDSPATKAEKTAKAEKVKKILGM